MIVYTKELILQVREMLERHWNTADIAQRLKLDPYAVQAIIDTINNILT